MTTIVTEGEYVTYMVVELTTIWTPPCESIIPFEYYDTTTCAPPQYESVWYDGGYYSPAICPSGYTAGCAPTKTMKSGQTGAICVPSGWECSADFQMHAYSVDDGETTSVPAFQIRWEEDDLSLLETHPLTPEAAATGDIDVGIDTTDDNPRGRQGGSNDDPGSDDSGLAKGAIAGIVVGVALFVALVLISGFIWYRKRYLKNVQAPGQGVEGDEKPGAAASQLVNPDGSPPVYPGVPQEMQGSHQFAPPGTIQDGTAKNPAEVQAIPAYGHNPPVQYVEAAVPHQVSHQVPYGMPVSYGAPGTAPMASELYTSTTRPSELGASGHLNTGTHPPELHGVDRVAGPQPHAAPGQIHPSPPVVEMQASTVRPTELGSG